MGGTHYYNQSLLFRNSTIASSIQETKRELSDIERAIIDSSPTIVFDKLRQVDPLIASKFHPNDTRRIRRALEIFFTTGERASEIYDRQRGHSDDEQGMLELRYRSLVFWIWCDQKILDPRLDSRVDQMVSNGLVQDIDEMFQYYNLLGSENVDLERGIWQVIGFKQFLPWLKQEVQSPDSGLEHMKLATRQYAKRQTKWIRKKLLPMVGNIQSGQPKMIDIGILDATDLSIWKSSVSARGIALAHEFLEQKNCSFTTPLVPATLQHLAETRPAEQEFDKSRWQHFVCNVCKNCDGQPLISIGKDNWEVHVNSRKHKSNIKKLKRHKQFEEWKIVHKRRDIDT